MSRIKVSPIFNRIRTRLSHNLRGIYLFFRFATTFRRRVGKYEHSVLFDIPEPRLERYYFLLAKFFDSAGWKVIIRFSPVLLLNLRNYNELIYKIGSLDFSYFGVTDSQLRLNLKAYHQRKKQIPLDVDYFNEDKDPDSYVLPYPMHPDVYETGIFNNLDLLRDSPRKIRVLSAGNTGDAYVNPEMDSLFAKVNRKRLTDLIEDQVRANRAIAIGSLMELEQLVPNVDIVLLSKHANLDTSDWMKTLSKSDFFIAAPGVSMPFSHNAVEAMAVGTIPIIEYGEMFVPPLMDGINCISFKGEDGFTDTLDRCRKMSSKEVAELGLGVSRYYDRYLDPKAVIQDLASKSGFCRKIYINAEHLSVIKLRLRRTTGVKN